MKNRGQVPQVHDKVLGRHQTETPPDGGNTDAGASHSAPAPFYLGGDGTAALRALWDCGVVTARWQHDGYHGLRQMGLAYISDVPAHSDGYAHKLTSLGIKAATHLFDNPTGRFSNSNKFLIHGKGNSK